jgi:hypothetical protein
MEEQTVRRFILQVDYVSDPSIAVVEIVDQIAVKQVAEHVVHELWFRVG